MNEQFRRHRFATSYPVTVYASAGLQKATIIDVNEGGARLIGLSDVARGEQITMTVLNDQVRAVVRWHGPNRTGISFAMPLPSRLIDIIRQSGGSTARWRHSSTGLTEMR